VNTLTYFKYVFSLVQFDVFENFPFFDYLSFIEYDKNLSPKVNQQMIDIGYDNRNAFSGLKMLTFVLLFFSIRVILSLCTGFFIAFLGFKNRLLNKAHYYIAKGIYFNLIIIISMEAYYEFFIVGFMNF
jgi:hypothetical protein